MDNLKFLSILEENLEKRFEDNTPDKEAHKDIFEQCINDYCQMIGDE